MKKWLILFFIVLTIESNSKNRLEEIDKKNEKINNMKEKKLKNLQEDLIEIANYVYPTPENTKDYIVIPFVSTSDIHGYLLEKGSEDTFFYGGASYFASYLENLRQEWGNNLIYVDSGDIYQGSYESKVTNGEIMSNYLNATDCFAASIGNHEFDYGQDYLEGKMTGKPNFFISDNIFKAGEEDIGTGLKGQIKYKIKEFPEYGIRIGFIALTTIETLFTSAEDLSYVFIDDKYAQIVEDKAKELREIEKVNAVVLISHLGMGCDNENEIKVYDLGLFNKDNGAQCQPSGELEVMINKLINKKAIDVVLAGHVHMNFHYFYQGVPVTSPKKSLQYFNIAYLYFDKTTKNVINDLTQLEGPIPVCSKVYSNLRRCADFNKDEETGDLKEFTFHGRKIIEDEKMKSALQTYYDLVNESGSKILFNLIGEEGEKYERVSAEENFLGNWATDVIRDATGADFAFINHGSFKTTWYPGIITYKDFYDMLPYDNFVIKFTLTGQEVKTLFEETQLYTGQEYNGLYPFSGPTVTYDKEKHKIINMVFSDGSELDLDSTYTLATISFLILDYGDDFEKIKEKINPQNINRYGIINENIIEWVKNHNEIVRVSDHFNPKEKPRLILGNFTEDSSSSSPSSDSSGSGSSETPGDPRKGYTIILNNQHYLKISSLAIFLLNLCILLNY